MLRHVSHKHHVLIAHGLVFTLAYWWNCGYVVSSEVQQLTSNNMMNISPLTREYEDVQPRATET